MPRTTQSPYVFNLPDVRGLRDAGCMGFHRSPVRKISFSPDGMYVVTGDDQGYLVIRSTKDGHPTVRVFKTGSKIRALAWHPKIQRVLLVGCGNGDLHKVQFDLRPVEDEIELRAVEIFSGFIHALAINNAGNQIAVAFGTRKVALVQVKDLNKRWDLNDICYLPLDDTLSVDGKRPIVKLFFMQNSLVVTFSSPELGIRAYSTTSPFHELWKIKTRENIDIGSSALSPSELLIAVANANDGIDWYLVPQRRFLHTTIYDFCGEYYMVDLEFLDDITVAAGHSQSRLIFATVGMLTQPQTYDFPGDPDCLIQAVSCKLLPDRRFVIAATSIWKFGSDNKESKTHVLIDDSRPIRHVVKYDVIGRPRSRAMDLLANASRFPMDIPVRAMILLLLLFGAACMAPRLCRATPPSMDANICPCTHTEGNMDVDQMQAHTVTQTVTAKDKAARHTIAIVGVPGHGH